MAKNYFIAGTDTDVGKTLVAQALLIKAQQAGLRTIGLKPVAAGAEETEDGWQNDDAQRLQRLATEALPYSQVNPVVFKMPVSPHIAAQKEGRSTSVSRLTGYIRGAMMQPADFRLVEGAGGWMVPVNDREPLSKLVVDLQLPVILVVGLKLGCLNHALLTARAIQQDGLPIAGWVATQIDPDMLCLQENIDSLHNMINAPCLGVIKYKKGIEAIEAAESLTLPVGIAS